MMRDFWIVFVMLGVPIATALLICYVADRVQGKEQG
jgi:hypothetical protein